MSQSSNVPSDPSRVPRHGTQARLNVQSGRGGGLWEIPVNLFESVAGPPIPPNIWDGKCPLHNPNNTLTLTPRPPTSS